MSRKEFIERELHQLKELLRGSKDDPFLGPQIEDRIRDAEAELAAYPETQGTLFALEEKFPEWPFLSKARP